MYCKKCGEIIKIRAVYCKQCGEKLSAIEPDISDKNIEALEDSGYNLGTNTLVVFSAWCALQIYFHILNFPSKSIDRERFWPFGFSDFSNYDLSELLFYIVVPATVLSIINLFVKKKNLNPLGLIKTYDLNYKPSIIPVLTGVIVLLLSLTFLIEKNASFHHEQNKMHIATNLFFVFTLIARISLLIMTVNLAKQLNRNATNWGVCAFIAPAITLIILGQKRKLLPY